MTHQLTGQKVLIKKDFNGVSIVYLLDSKGNKIEQPKKNIHGNTAYETAVCSNNNLVC